MAFQGIVLTEAPLVWSGKYEGSLKQNKAWDSQPSASKETAEKATQLQTEAISYRKKEWFGVQNRSWKNEIESPQGNLLKQDEAPWSR